jgi:hypothetical protein
MPYLITLWSTEPRYINNDLFESSDPLPTTANIWRITICLWCVHARIYGEWDTGRVYVECVFCHHPAFALVNDFGAEYHITFGDSAPPSFRHRVRRRREHEQQRPTRSSCAQTLTQRPSSGPPTIKKVLLNCCNCTILTC